MTRKSASKAKTRAQRGARKLPSAGTDRIVDVTVVVLKDGYASTAVAPIEIFHAAGVVWNWLHGEPVKPRFRVRTASIDGRSVKSICALGLTPDGALSDIKKADIIIVPASGWDAID